MERPLVSLVTPAYNHARHLAEAIESVLGQDYPAIEYIVLDDGSTDQTRDVLARYTGRLRWETQANMGQARTLNRGWSGSSGSLLGYLSADDVLLPHAVTRLVEALERHPEAVVAYPDFHLIDPYSRIIRRSSAGPPRYREMVMAQASVVGPGALFRRWAYQKVGGWNPDLRFIPDFDFLMRIGLLGTLVQVAEPLAAFRMHSSSISFRRTDASAAEEHLRVVDDYFRRGDVPADLREAEPLARAAAELAAARIHLRGGRVGAALAGVRRARALDRRLGLTRLATTLLRALTSRSVHRATWRLRHLFHRARPSNGWSSDRRAKAPEMQ